ncbi:MAG: hypothetical protein ABIK85_10470 [Candidatus Eisenbacteria bacterium]
MELFIGLILLIGGIVAFSIYRSMNRDMDEFEDSVKQARVRKIDANLDAAWTAVMPIRPVREAVLHKWQP